MLLGKTLFRPLFPVGHEFVGEIVELSPDESEEANEKETGFTVGQKVALAFQVACGTSPLCAEGHSKSCESISGAHDYGMGAGGENFGGALSDLVLVPWQDAREAWAEPGTKLVVKR